MNTLPCMGAVTISLVETPYIDFSLHLFKKFDLMLPPGVSQIANYFIQLVSSYFSSKLFGLLHPQALRLRTRCANVHEL